MLMPGRKPLYQSNAERPVTLCVRVPRALYNQLQAQMDIRRMSLTDAALDALQLWVETPADLRDTETSPSGNTTVLRQFEELVDARLEALEAALATLRREAPASTESMQPSPDTLRYNNSITDVIQELDATLPAPPRPAPSTRGPASAAGRRAANPVYGALSRRVAETAAQLGRFTNAELAAALGRRRASCHKILEGMVTAGTLQKDGLVYAYVASAP